MNTSEIIQQLFNALSLGATYSLLALGFSMVFSVMGLVNFAYGELVAITGYTMYLAIQWEVPWGLAALLGVGAAVIASVLMERIAFRPLRNASFLTLLFTSFAVAVIIQNIFRAAVSPRQKGVPTPEFLNSAVHIGPVSISWMSITSLVVSGLALGLLMLFLSRSTSGIAMRAAAEDFDVTRLMGVKANRVILLAFVISGALAGVAGVLWVSRLGAVSPTMGFVPVLKAFIAVVIGGLGSLSGAVVGAFTLAFLEVAFQVFLPTSVQPFADPFVLLVIGCILYFKPNGLLDMSVERV